MLDKSTLRKYVSGFSYFIAWCTRNIRIVDGHEDLVLRDTMEFIKNEHKPILETLRNYLIVQLRSIQKDESILKAVLKKEKVLETELSIEESIIAAISEIIVNINRSFSLLESESWSFLMSEFITYVKAADNALHSLELATRSLKELINSESAELKAEYPAHQKEIKRILLELCV